jgi:citronellol/citronellal dehydrogenase
VTLTPHTGFPGLAHSSAARAAVENLIRVPSIEWARHRINLSAVAPGIVEPEVLASGTYPPEVVEHARRSTPAGARPPGGS